MTRVVAADRLRLRRATAGDAPRLEAIVSAAGRAMAEEGFMNWASPEPVAGIRDDIATREVYAVDLDGHAPATIATFTLGATARRAYVPEPWADPRAPTLYLNRLAVEPSLQGGGVGGWCLGEIERLARDRGARAVRCDVLSENRRLCRLYERFGYIARGARPHRHWQFTCYELPVD